MKTADAHGSTLILANDPGPCCRLLLNPTRSPPPSLLVFSNQLAHQLSILINPEIFILAFSFSYIICRCGSPGHRMQGERHVAHSVWKPDWRTIGLVDLVQRAQTPSRVAGRGHFHDRQRCFLQVSGRHGEQGGISGGVSGGTPRIYILILLLRAVRQSSVSPCLVLHFQFEETLTGFKWMGNKTRDLQAQGKRLAFAPPSGQRALFSLLLRCPLWY